MTTGTDRDRDAETGPPGYGDQGPAGGGRTPDQEDDEAVEPEEEPSEPDDLD